MKCTLLVSKSETVLNFRRCLIQHLQQNGYTVQVVAYDDDYQQEIRALNVDFFCVRQENRWLNPFAIVRYAYQVYRLLKQQKPDMVMTFQLKPNTFGVLAAKAAGVKRINTMIEGAGDVFTYDTLKWKLIRLVSCSLYKTALRHAQKVFFLNREDEAEFTGRKLVQKEKCRVIPGIGVDLEHFYFQPIQNQRRFLMIARMLKTKGVLDYCECARLVKEKYPDAQFCYLGMEGDIKLKDIQPYADAGIIEYLGTAKDVRPHLAKCTALVLPSYREGLPMSVMEAEATGRGIITSDTIGCKDTVKDNYNGFLVPVRDPEALSKCCIKLIEKPELAMQMGMRSRQFAEEKFDEKVINAYLLQEL
ncbi:MAG: glycosyltransferase family 4 protein [Oscillospiraceae bacterium]|nr:glycosyltransferase family 4 protein [Oscillospiraceae bacterium]